MEAAVCVSLHSSARTLTPCPAVHSNSQVFSTDAGACGWHGGFFLFTSLCSHILRSPRLRLCCILYYGLRRGKRRVRCWRIETAHQRECVYPGPMKGPWLGVSEATSGFSVRVTCSEPMLVLLSRRGYVRFMRDDVCRHCSV